MRGTLTGSIHKDTQAQIQSPLQSSRKKCHHHFSALSILSIFSDISVSGTHHFHARDHSDTNYCET